MTTLESYLNAFTASLTDDGRRPRTIDSYAEDVDRFISWFTESRGSPPTLETVSTNDIKRYQQYMQMELALTINSINRRLTGLRIFFAWAVTADLIAANPVAPVTSLKWRKPTPRWLTPDEQVRLHDALAHRPARSDFQLLRNRAIVLLLLHTGVRVQELVQLTVDDIDLHYNEGTLHIREGRGGHARSLPLNKSAREVLQVYLAARPGDWGEALFPGGPHGALSSRQVQRILNNYAFRVGLPPAVVTSQNLRHTFARNLVVAGVPLDQVARLLDYTTLEAVQRYVTEMHPLITKRRQIQAIADLLRGLTPDLALEQMTDPFEFFYRCITEAPDENPQDVLSDLRLKYDDLHDIIDIIREAPPGRQTTYPSLAQLGRDFPPTEWLWEGWIPHGYLTLLAAWPGAGKTYVALDLARRLLHQQPAPDGTPLLCRDATPTVIYVDAEDFLPVLYERVQGWQMNLQQFYPLRRPPRDLLDLTQPHYQDRLIDMVYDLKPTLLIIDSLSSINSRGENSIEELRGVLSFLVEMTREARCATVLVHHLRKPQRGRLATPISMHDLRGTGHLTAMARCIIGLDVLRTGHQGDPNNPLRQLKILKNNLSKQPAPLNLALVEIDGSNTVELQFSEAAMPASSETEVETCVQWLQEALAEGPLSYAELRERIITELGANESMLQRARQLLGAAVVDTVGPRRKGNKWMLSQGEPLFLEQPSTNGAIP